MKTQNVMKLLIILLSMAALAACGSSGGGGGGGGGNGGGCETGDIIKLSIDGGALVTYSEKSSTDIDFDPRVDWHSNQVILQNNYYTAYSDYETVFDIMFLDDSVGVYNTTAGPTAVQPIYAKQGVMYYANFSLTNSSAMVEVTRSDTRIQGTFIVNTTDLSDNPGPQLTGTFDVAAGATLNCQ